ncbi:hypothetical protein [Endozoicomonas sp. YOMI1]|uniref:hypothetical protein n=1 Tax=Endozoicomonas sp. YOMI1 TaxID=2828739 RepID=UPI00214816B7|nr:hypothetical protein [Endozoicomonas sp. YOMI1]
MTDNYDQVDNSTTKWITAEKQTQYDWAKTLSKPIFQRFIKQAQAARFIAMGLLPWENSLKEISTILTIWDTLKKHIPYSPDDKFIVLDVGSGPSPKLGAWIALNTDWPVLSIDPVLQTPNSVLPDNLTLIAKPVEEVNLSGRYDLSEYHVVVLMMHAHVSTDQACLPVETWKRLSLITIPCCDFSPRQNDIHNIPFDFELAARDMLSIHSTVRVWCSKSFPLTPTPPLQKEKCNGSKEVNEVPLAQQYAGKNIQHIKVNTANVYTQYDDTIYHIDRFINYWKISLRSPQYPISEGVYNRNWLFRKSNMINWLSRAIHIEGITKEILPDKNADRKNTENVSVVIVEAGRTPRFGAWLSSKLKKEMISICKPSDSKQLSPHWKVGVNLEICCLEDFDIQKKNYLVIVVSDEFTPDRIVPLFHRANKLSMIFNTGYPCHRRGQVKPDESRLIWDVISPLRRFHIWHSVPLPGRT